MIIEKGDKEVELKKLGEKIRKIRMDKGLSQTQLGYLVNKDQQSIQRLESGRMNPSYFYLLEISIGLKVELKELIG